MSYATSLIVGEWVRREALDVEGQEPKVLAVDLYPVVDGTSRARGSPKYQVTALLEWRAVESQAFDLVDARGYGVRWTLAQVAGWLVKSLPGSHCVVTISIRDAFTLPPAWTDARMASQAAKLAKLDPIAIRAAAEAKRATANKMTEGSDKKGQLLASADAMVETAAQIDALRAV